MNKISAAITGVSKTSYPALYKGPLKEGVAKASLHGFDAVELHISNSSEVDGPRFFEYCMAKHISISAISTGLAYSMRGLSLSSENPDTRESAIRCMVEFVSLAKELQTGIIIGLIRGLCSPLVRKEKTVELLRQSMDQILNQAEAVDVPVYFEAIASFLCNYFCTIEESVEFVASFKNPLLKLHIDTYTMAHEESDILGSIAACEGFLGYVHYSDTDRLVPGKGTINFPAITKELKRIGYEGYVALECVPFPDADVSGPFAVQYVRSLFHQE